MTATDFSNLLPPFNASCNATAALCLLMGWFAIRKKKITLHRNLMCSAFGISVLFLIGYLTRYYLTGATHFEGKGFWRTFYFTILISHSILALINVPLVLRSLYLGLRNRIDSHRKWARVTLPIWLYVSVTGVLIYFMLYILTWR
jgi:putative membrane protein